MNRHARHALLTPLLVSAVAVPPAMAAQAAPLGVAAPGAVPQAVCKLVVATGTNPVEFDLQLTGFRAGQQVRVEGPETFTRTVSASGSVTEEDVKKGSYTVIVRGDRNNRGMTVSCSKPPRTPPPPATGAARVSAVDITGASTSPAEVDCKVPQNVTFTGKITGTGTGEVSYTWTSGGRQTTPSVNFTAPETATATFVVKSPTRAAPTDPAPKVEASLKAGSASDSAGFTLKCAPGT
ncbi:hypothetical protein [Streptomyces bambusae]|uniref:Ig-like domain-containing protein n=1 Tax=Streptomyces bambusae TaxID=1550616 RepID=A0ABS6ZBX9_9ACTN|nr:hypothetical protein [Streptomyces bambusae]MBW5485101.1 hypothetical protein [Streptomyces bambusae]